MTSPVSNMGVWRDLGPCRLVYKNVDLGSQDPDDGVRVKMTESMEVVGDARKGSVDVDHIRTGIAVEVEAVLSRTSAAILKSVVSYATGSASRFQVLTAVGGSMYEEGGTLIIQPYTTGGVPTTDDREWLYVLMAGHKVDFDIPFGPKEQRSYKVTFYGFPVQNDDDGTVGSVVGAVWCKGDPAKTFGA